MRTLTRLLSMAVGAAIASATPAHAADLGDKKITSFQAMDECLTSAVKNFYTQTEPATIVAIAALAMCTAEILEVKTAYGFDTLKEAEDATRPHVIAQVMALRAVTKAPAQHSSAPAKKEYMQ